jgi:hypothetical protein
MLFLAPAVRIAKRPAARFVAAQARGRALELSATVAEILALSTRLADQEVSRSG